MTALEAYNHRARLADLLRREGRHITEIAQILRVRPDEARSLLGRAARLDRAIKKIHP